MRQRAASVASNRLRLLSVEPAILKGSIEGKREKGRARLPLLSPPPHPPPQHAPGSARAEAAFEHFRFLHSRTPETALER